MTEDPVASDPVGFPVHRRCSIQMPSTTSLDFTPFRDRFVIDQPELVYLDGNSLGRLPQATVGCVQRVVGEQWGRGLIGSWNQHWLGLSKRIGEKIGQLIGAKPGETIVCDSTSVNLYKLAWALLQDRGDRKKIITDSANFPTDVYVLAGIGQHLAPPLELRMVDLPTTDPTAILETLNEAIDEQTALVCLSHVHFKSGFAFDIAAVTRLAHARGTRILWDLSHSVGAMPIDLAGADVDAAVGCTYKYLNGGPGAPAFLMVRSDLQSLLRNPIQGWFGSANPFQFSLDYCPHPAIERFVVGTPPVLSLAAIEPGVDLVLEAGIENLRERSIGLTELFIERYDDQLKQLGYSLQTPREAAMRGSHVSIGHEHGWQITQALIEKYGVIPDFREPNTIRFGITPLYTIRQDIEQAITALTDAVSSGSYRNYSATRQGVT